jgi:glycosyltransferase involved in cell wall biosynthesis
VPLRITFVTHRFERAGYGIQVLVSDLCEELAVAGDRIQLISTSLTFKGSFEYRGFRVKVCVALKGLVDPVSPSMLFTLLTDNSDIVVANGFKFSSTLFAVLVARVRRRPTFVIFHGVGGIAHSKLGLIRDNVVTYLIRNSDSVLITLNDADKASLIAQYGFDEKSIRVVRFGMSSQDLKLGRTARLRRADAPLKLLFVGRLSVEKRVKKLLAVVKELAETKCVAELLIVGDGPEMKNLEAYARKLGVTSLVRFLGSVPHDEIWRYYADCDLLVLTSEFEGSPRVILEAFLSGRPVIAPRLPTITEMISDGRNGFTYSRFEDLVTRLRSLSTSKKSLEEMEEYCLQSATSYSIQSTAVFRKLLQESLTQRAGTCRLG